MIICSNIFISRKEKKKDQKRIKRLYVKNIAVIAKYIIIVSIKEVLHPDQFCDCLCIFVKYYNTLVTGKICFLEIAFKKPN